MASNTEEAKLVRVGNTSFLVDGFLFQREDVGNYVLTHFHSDHTVGLNQRFAAGVIYCTEVTAALITEITHIDPARVVGMQLGVSREVGDVLLTMLDADHCPGSAVVVFEQRGVDKGPVVVHTGDCRASQQMREGLLNWLDGRMVQELFLDTTYCSPRWRFPAQVDACRWLAEITKAELQREPKTLFIVGCYQIGKERAVQAVAEAASSSAYVEHRRWKVVQLAGWGDYKLSCGRPLWSIDKEGCSVWMTALGSLGHDALKHFLDNTKGQFEALVAFRPTGWTWAPKAMGSHGSEGCRVWAENDGKTRIYGVPYSEHSSYDELQSLANALKPKRVVPTVNSETRSAKEKMLSHFLSVVDLKADPERIDHYVARQQSLSEDSFVDVLAVSSGSVSSASSSSSTQCPEPSYTFGGASSSSSGRASFRWRSGSLRGGSTGSCSVFTLTENATLEEVVELSDDDGMKRTLQRLVTPPTADEAAEELRRVDLEQQKRLIRFFEASRRQDPAAPNPEKKDGKRGAKGWSGPQKTWAGGSGSGGRGKGKGKGKGKGPAAPEAAVLRGLGVVKPEPPPEPTTTKGKAKRKAPKKTPDSAASTPKRSRTTKKGPSSPADPKAAGEKRPSRFIPKPSARVKERIERAFGHRLYFLDSESLDEGAGAYLNVLGSTGNVYKVELRREGLSCTCLDFAKSSCVCKHLLFVTLRVLKLPREDHRVWQTSLTPSELKPLLEQLHGDVAGDVKADATLLRGFREARGEVPETTSRRPLPADCPICFEQIVGTLDPESGTGPAGVVFCHTCGHNMHSDCRNRWAAAGKAGDACPLCRSPWKQAAPKDGSPINLAAYSSEYRDVNLMALYPETHRWIRRRESGP